MWGIKVGFYLMLLAGVSRCSSPEESYEEVLSANRSGSNWTLATIRIHGLESETYPQSTLNSENSEGDQPSVNSSQNIRRHSAGWTAFTGRSEAKTENNGDTNLLLKSEDSPQKCATQLFYGGKLVKVAVGIGSVVAAGALGFKYMSSYLRKRRRRSLDRGPSPYSNLLGNVLLSNDTGKSVSEVATSDVLGKPNRVTALYFSGHAVEDALSSKGYPSFTSRLESIVKLCEAKNNGFDVVYVSADQDSGKAASHFATMPWYAVPHDDEEGRQKINNLYRRFRIAAVPAVVLLDENANVINSNAYTQILLRPNEYPWYAPKVRDILENAKYIDKSGHEVDKSDLAGRPIALYFGADWCPGCKAFLPKLKEMINVLNNTSDKPPVIVYVSNDKDKDSAMEIVRDLGILTIPFEDIATRAMIQDTLNIRSLPALVWLREDGSVQSRRGVHWASVDLACERYPWEDPLVGDISDAIESIAQSPVLIAFAEHAPDTVSSHLVNELESAAKQLSPDQSETQIPPSPPMFVAKTSDQRTMALRHLCQLPVRTDSTESNSSTGSTIVILDLVQQSVYHLDVPNLSDVSADDIIQFVKKYQNDELLPKGISLQ